MERFTNIEGIIFDMDGTLIDSETLTHQSVHRLLDELDIRHECLDDIQFHGITWAAIDARLKSLYPELEHKDLARWLERLFNHYFIKEPPPLITGAKEAFLQAARLFPTAIATSGKASAVERFLDSAGIREACTVYISSEVYRLSKPHPECFLLAAEKLGVRAETCLVFEDSLAGLEAARNAGMRTIALGQKPPGDALSTNLADLVIGNYTGLPLNFFASLRTNRK